MTNWQKKPWLLWVVMFVLSIGLAALPVRSQASQTRHTIPKSLRGTWYYSGYRNRYKMSIKSRSWRYYQKKHGKWRLLQRINRKKLVVTKTEMLTKSKRFVNAYRISDNSIADAPDIRVSHRTINHQVHRVLITTAQDGPEPVWTKFQPKKDYHYVIN